MGKALYKYLNENLNTAMLLGPHIVEVFAPHRGAGGSRAAGPQLTKSLISLLTYFLLTSWHAGYRGR